MMSREGTHKEKVNLNAGGGGRGQGGDHHLLLRGRCPANGATATPCPPTTITRKEHKLINVSFFSF